MTKSPEIAASDKSKPNTNQTRSDSFMRFVRVWVVLQAIATIAAAPFVLGLFGYGLAHASSETVIPFLIVFVIAVAVLAGVPLALLFHGKGILLRATQLLGSVVLLVVLGGLILLVYGLTIDPKKEARQFEQTIKTLSVLNIEEKPELIAGKVAGLRLAIDIILPQSISFDSPAYGVNDRIGQAVWVFIREPQAGTVERDINNNGWAPFTLLGSPSRISLNGTPIESLPAFKPYIERGHYGPLTLPAGTYRVETVLWFAGLNHARQSGNALNNPEQPCRATPLSSSSVEVIKFSNDRPLEARLGTTFSLGGRRGYHGFRLSRPLKFRFDYAKWMAELPSLPLESCDAR